MFLDRRSSRKRSALEQRVEPGPLLLGTTLVRLRVVEEKGPWTRSRQLGQTHRCV